MMRVYPPSPAARKRPPSVSPPCVPSKRCRLDCYQPVPQQYDHVVVSEAGSDDDTCSSSTADQDSRRVRFSSHTSFSEAKHDRADRTNWYCKADREEWRAENSDLVDDLFDSREVQRLQRVWEQASGLLTTSSSDRLESTVVSLPTEIRGLEWGIYDKIAIRQDHVNAVLWMQHDASAKALADRAIKSSGPSRTIARVLGKSDEASVKSQETARIAKRLPASHRFRREEVHQPLRRIKVRMW